MRLIPIFAWNKSLYTMHIRRKHFMEKPWAQGLILLVSVIVAMTLANWDVTAQWYEDILHTEFTLNLVSPAAADGSRLLNISFPQEMTIDRFINDILMVVFFFTVGLEIKREVKCGELSTPRRAMLPILAAMGGMFMPAAIYGLLNFGTPAATGWGIPTATDIAFAVGIMSCLGPRVPVSLKIFLTALAIADDLGAILVVAFFYGEQINLPLLGVSLIIIILVRLLNRLGEKRLAFYLIPAVVLWALFYYAGIHATMSGVVMAFMIPMESRYNLAYLRRKDTQYHQRLLNYENCAGEEGVPFPNGPQRHCLRRISHIHLGTMGMSYRLEHALSHWVTFGIMPIFALANAGVRLPDVPLHEIFRYTPEMGSAGLGIFLGLVLGKPIGITLASWISIKLRLGTMPDKATWAELLAVSCLGGIGFTMSIFIDMLSFHNLPPEAAEALQSAGKLAVLIGSTAAALLGILIIQIVHHIKRCAPVPKG